MANKTTSAATEATETTSTEKKAERKIPIEKLRRSCVKLFGITPSTFDGATVGMDGKFTVTEMQTHITEWLNKPVILSKKGG